ncbi:MAG: hypothetical protein ACREHF_13620 [Rhizomicrobium sp.]
MEPVRIAVSRIIDFGTIVSIVGVDISSQESVVVHLDHRPFAAVWEAWRAAGFPEPIEFDAEALTLRLDVDDDQGGDRVLQAESAAAGDGP